MTTALEAYSKKSSDAEELARAAREAAQRGDSSLANTLDVMGAHPPAAPPPSPSPEPAAQPATESSVPSTWGVLGDAVWNSMFGTPDMLISRPGTAVPGTDGTFVQELLTHPQTKAAGETIADVLGVNPRPDSLDSNGELISPDKKELLDKAQLKAMLRDQNAIDLFTIGRAYNNKFVKQNKIVDDYDKMSPLQFAKKHGIDVYTDMANLGMGGRKILNYAHASSDAADSLRDIGVHAVAGALKGGTDLTALGMYETIGGGSAAGKGIDAFSELFGGPKFTDLIDQGAVAVAQSGSKASEAVRTAQSDPSFKQELVGALMEQADHIDQSLEYAKDVATEGETIAKLRYAGKNVKDTFARYYNNPKTLENLTSDALGSLALTGPLAKGLGLATTGAGALTVGEKILGKAVARFGEGARFSTAVGLQEAAGGFSDAAQRVMGMSHTDLVNTSPEYRTLISSGYSEEEAKIRLAAATGGTAAPIAFGTGFITSKLAPREFETNPLGVGTRRSLFETLKELPRDAAREVIEEVPQSAAGQFAVNAALKSNVNPNQGLGENVGEAGVQGGLAAAGVGPMAKAPVIAYKAIKAPFQIGFKALADRAKDIRAKNAAGSTVSDEKLSVDARTAVEVAPALGEELRAMVDNTHTAEAVSAAGEAPADPTAPVSAPVNAPDPETEDFIKKVEKAAVLQPEDLDVLPQHIVETLVQQQAETGKPVTRFDAMTRMAKLIEDPKTSEDDKVSAAMFVAEVIQSNTDLFSKQLPKVLEDTHQDHPTFKKLDDYVNILQRMKDNPRVAEAIRYGQDELVMPDRNLAQMDLASPEAQQVIKNVVGVSTHAPARLNENLATEVLNQADEGTINLTPDQRNTIRNALALGQQGRKHGDPAARLVERGPVEQEVAQLRQELGATEAADTAPAPAAEPTPAEPKAKTNPKTDFVARQIETEGGSQRHQLSMRQHVAEINRAIKNKDMKELKNKIRNLADFAKSHANKVAAVNESIDEGKGQNKPYQALSSAGTFYNNKKGIGINVGNAGSENLARQIHKEATSIAELANHFIAQHPELNLKPVPMPPELSSKIDPKIGKSAEEGSTAAHPVTAPSPATTTETADTDTAKQTKQTEPSPASTPKTAPTATDTTAAVAKTSVEPKTKGKSKVIKSLEDLGTALEAKTVETKTAEPKPETKSEKPPESKVESPAEPVAEKVVQEEVEPETVTLDEAHPDLVRPDKGNFFLKSYKRAKEMRSRLMSVTSPLALMRSLISSPKALTDQGIKSTAMPKKQGAWKDYMQLAEHIIYNMKIRLETTLKEKDEQGRTLLNRLDKGHPINRYMNLKALNIVEKVDGIHRYNQQLIESATLAGMDWLLNIQDRLVQDEDSKLAGILGVDENLITQNILDRWNSGISLSTAKRSLAEQLKRFWDVRDNKDVSETYVQGVAEAMALELLHGMEQAGLLQTGLFKAPELTNLTYGQVYFNQRTEDTATLMRVLGEERNTISDIALVDKLRGGRSVGEPITEVAKTQLRNPNVKTTRQQRKAVDNVQNARHWTNMPMVGLMQALGLEAYVTMRGGAPIDSKTTNVNDAKSKNGVRAGLIAAFNGMLSHVAEVQAYADRNKTTVDKVPTFFEYAITSVGRMQMRGVFNSQTSKLARNIVTPIRAIIDLSKPASNKFTDWLQGIGQGLGVKTENLSRREVVIATMAKIKANRAIIDEIKSHLNQVSQKKKAPLSKQATQMFVDAQFDDHSLQALLDYARYEVSRETKGDLTKFESWNFLEADGKTNGPINALMLWAAGPVTPRFLELVAKGGMFFGVTDKTLDQHADKVDLYKASGNKASENVGELHKAIAADQNPKVLDHFAAFRRVMSALNTEIVVKGNEIEISRGFAKNPLTITVYGSGLAGISTKAAAELTRMIYVALSESMQTGKPLGELVYQGYPDNNFVDDLNTITNKIAGKYKEDPNKTGKQRDKAFYVRPANKHSDLNLSNDEQKKAFTFNESQFDALKNNMQFFLTEPLVRAITSEMMGELRPVLRALQRATQIQSIVVRNLFQNKVFEKIADKKLHPEKYPDYNEGDFLSQNELNEIYDSLRMFAPVIDTGTQRYELNSKERADVFVKGTVTDANGVKHTIQMPKTFAESLTGDMKTPIFMNTPDLADVSAIPNLNIGSGDGQMMLHGMSIDINQSDISQNTLPVFDGLNMPIDQILEYSQLINEAVHKTWTQNSPMRAVAESFRTFTQNRPLEQVLAENDFNITKDDTAREMSKVYHERKAPPSIIGQTEMQDMIDGLVTELNGFADDLDIRQQVYRETQHAIDQMASGKGPYNNKGSLEIPANASAQEIARIMEGRRLELTKAKTKASKEAEAVETVPADTPIAQLTPSMQSVLNLGTEDVSGARVIQADQLPDMVNNLSGIMTERIFIKQLIKAIGSEYKIIFGTPSQLDTWERANNSDRHIPGSNDNAMGKIDPTAKIILVSNLVPETIIHELIHAATIDKVRAFYSNPMSLSQEDRDAIRRIEGLMNEWRTLDFSNNEQAVVDAHTMAQASIEGHLLNGRQAEGLNEFMAWTLSNPAIAAQAKKIKNPIFRIASEALEVIKSWLSKNLRVPDNLLDQLRFNTRVLVSMPTNAELLKNDANSVVMYQSPAFGNSDRLTWLRDRFNTLINTYLTEGDQNVLEVYHRTQLRKTEVRLARQASRDLVVSFAQHFGDLKLMQAWSTFYAIQTALMTDIKLNPNSLARIQELYDHVISNLEVKDLKENTDPNDQADNHQAQRRFDAIHGLFVKKTDAYGRSTLMSSFLALAMTSESFRNVLAKMGKPKTEKNTTGGLDGLLENVGMAGIERTSLLMSGERRSDRDVQEALDDLTTAMIENIGDQRSVIEQRTENGIGAIDRYLFDNMQALSEKLIVKSNDIIANSTSKIARAGARLLRITGTIVNEDSSTKAAQGMVNALARLEGFHEVRAIANDIVLRTDENAPIYDMISESRAVAQQTRQRFREEVPQELANKFSRPLTEAETTAKFHAMGTSDLAVLNDSQGATGAIRAITDTAHRNTLIRAREASIQASEGTRATKILEKAKQLAAYLNGAGHGDNLLSNAYAISRLNGEAGFTVNPSAQLEQDVDELVTLYKIQGLTQETKDTMAELAATEKDGLEFMFHYLVGQRKDELIKTKATELSRNNHYKGDIPSEQIGEDSLVIESDSKHADMLKKGYSRVGAYTGSSADRTLSAKSYYYSPTAGLAPYRQGVMQTVHVTASGVDPQTGYTVGKTIAGRITDGRIIAQTQRLRANQRATNENLKIIYNSNGTAIAMERMADVAQTNAVKRNTNLLEMVAAWRGRQVEEIFGTEINRSLVNELSTIWENARREGRANEFVNVLTSNDPIIKNTAKLIPNQMKDHITQKFGKDTFMVHRSMALNALGDRQASVADLFTGETRWKPEVQQRLENLALGIFGNSAFNKLVASERLVQNVITNVKYNIVVKSVVVPVANIISNMGQLLNRDVPLRDVLRGIPAKSIEINQYIKARSKEIKLEAALRAAKGKNDLVEIRKLEDRLQALEDSYRRLSIYPLIKAGEFSAISSGEVTAEDLALSDGKWSNFMDKMIVKIPDGPLRTVARYGLVTRDTAMFQALAKSVQYGDFVAKAILYDDLVNRQKVKSKSAIASVNQAFVPYNNLSGRGRHYLESIGLLWFYNYKIRIMKEAVYMLRHHPFRSLIMNGIPGLNSMDSPLDSNFLTTLINGHLGYSIGPEMAMHSWTLNPWVNLVR